MFSSLTIKGLILGRKNKSHDWVYSLQGGREIQQVLELDLSSGLDHTVKSRDCRVYS